ncbi:MAG TPA: glycosyltransferase [Miltoncostaeaceae bacterium]|nr:glycosyltransferase [Miltoncostaeaceae bacterium]
MSGSSDRPQRALRVMWLGTYERDYPRTRVLIEGLRARGVEVVERHRPVWERHRHKSGGGFVQPRRLAANAGRFLAAWLRVAPRALARRPRPDAVVVGYPAQPDVVAGWAVARALRVPLVVDMLVSLADPFAGDRGLVGRRLGALLARVDRLALSLADIVVCDTDAHALFFHERFSVPWGKLVVCPVGAQPGLFAPAPRPTEGAVHALFYGKLSPLHGLETLLAAARAPGVPPVRVVGDGQLGGWLAGELERDRPRGFSWERWVPYERLAGELAGADICLGVFGTSDKAARVVANKVWQAMAVGRPIVTADTPGAREVLRDGESALLVPPGDAPALAAALRRLAGDAALRERLADGARAEFVRRGLPAVVAQPLERALRCDPRIGGAR